jgi:hypothetical protein
MPFKRACNCLFQTRSNSVQVNIILQRIVFFFSKKMLVRIIKVSDNLTRDYLCFISLTNILWWITQIIEFFTKVKYIYLKWEKCILLYFVYYVYFSDYGKEIEMSVNKYFHEINTLSLFLYFTSTFTTRKSISRGYEKDWFQTLELWSLCKCIFTEKREKMTAYFSTLLFKWKIM